MGGRVVSPEETTGQGWKMDVTVGKEEAASGLTPGGGDRTAGTRVPEEGGTRQAELSPESLAEAGMQASEVVSRHGDEGKIRTGRGRVEGERNHMGARRHRTRLALPLLAQRGSSRAAGSGYRRLVWEPGKHVVGTDPESQIVSFLLWTVVVLDICWGP